MGAGPSLLRNSLLLYGRMILVMGAGLLLSRLLLSAMGVAGYGVYSLLWGVVMLLAFFESAMTTAFQRFFGNDIGASDAKALKADFGAAVICSLLSSVVLLAIGAVVAYLVLPHLDIPDNFRPFSWGLLLLCLSAMAIRFVRIPMLSLLLSREKMGAYAWVSVSEAGLKLMVAVSLPYIAVESLTAYCLALPAIDGLVAASLALYCRRIPEARVSLKLARPRVAQMLRFTVANALGSGADVGVRQGCNIVVNLFFGVVLNASVALCSQARVAVTALTGSVQTAVAPRIFSYYGAGRRGELRNLIITLSCLSFLLTSLIAIPLGVCSAEVLALWLETPPPWASEMFSVMCIVCVLDSLSGPLWLATVAHGKIWGYQAAVSFVMLLNVPVVALAFRLGADPVALYIVECLLFLCVLAVRVFFADRFGLIGCWLYLRKVVFPLLCVGITGLAAAQLGFCFHSFWCLVAAAIFSWIALFLSFKLLCARTKKLASLWRGDIESSLL